MTDFGPFPSSASPLQDHEDIAPFCKFRIDYNDKTPKIENAPNEPRMTLTTSPKHPINATYP